MSSTPTEAPPTFVLSSRALRFRVVAGDETGYAVTRLVGLGGAVLKASVVPQVGTRVRLIERYGARGADVHVDAEVVATIPTADLSGREPGFCAAFRQITMRGDERHLMEFIATLEPGYSRLARPSDRFEPCDDPIRGPCSAYTPSVPFSTQPLLEAAGLDEGPVDDWDDGLEHVDLDLEPTIGTAPTPAAPLDAPLPAAASTTGPAARPGGAHEAPAPRRRGFTGLLGGLFGRGRDDGD